MTVEGTRLQHDPDALAQRAAARAGVVPEHRHVATTAFPVALEDLDRGRLARAVGTEQTEHLAALDADIHAAQRFEVAIGLAQPGDLDRGCRTAQAAAASMPPPRAPTSERPW